MMSAKGNPSKFTCKKYLKSTEAFLRAQISLLRPQRRVAEVGISIRRLKSCIKVLKGVEADEPEQRSCTTESVKDPDFPYLIGIVAQAAMIELFERNMLTDDDVQYLRSPQAQHDFVCRKIEFIRPYQNGDKTERQDKSGRDRYYFPAPILEWRGKKYYLTKELTKAKLPNLLQWIFAHGLERSDLVAVCEKFVGRRNSTRSRRNSSRTKGSSSAPLIASETRPQKAVKPGKYVNNFFRWISELEIKLPASCIKKGLDLRWSVSNLDLWRPLFATEETLTQADRDGRRFWGKPFNFGGECLYVNSQWYGKKRGAKQKAGFDKMAMEIAKACGFRFSPYPLPGIPETNIKEESYQPYSQKPIASMPCAEQGPGGVTICVTSTKKKSFRLKG